MQHQEGSGTPVLYIGRTVLKVKSNRPDADQPGRWSSFGKRVWFTESHYMLFLYYLLLY
jgi:hypothetical protein